MDKKTIAGIIAAFFLIAMLFSPIDSKIWIWFLILGLAFGAVWWMKN